MLFLFLCTAKAMLFLLARGAVSAGHAPSVLVQPFQRGRSKRSAISCVPADITASHCRTIDIPDLPELLKIITRSLETPC